MPTYNTYTSISYKETLTSNGTYNPICGAEDEEELLKKDTEELLLRSRLKQNKSFVRIGLNCNIFTVLISIGCGFAIYYFFAQVKRYREEQIVDIPTIDSSTKNSYTDFTLKRNEYTYLPYFDADELVERKYKFLLNYRAVIEPGKEMELYFFRYNLADSDFYYTFTICPISTSSMGTPIGADSGYEQLINVERRNSDSQMQHEQHNTNRIEAQTDPQLENQHNPTTLPTAVPCQTAYKYNDQTKNTVDIKTSVKFDCVPYEKFSISINKYNNKHTLTEQLSGSAICMYVRRELRALNDADQNKFYETAYELWKYGDKEGEKRYGQNFHSNTGLYRLHYFNAAQQDSDHIHDGNGFLMQHIKFSNYFEQSLQSVDSSISLPYWDYTRDSASGATSIYMSDVMVSEKFGSMPKAKDNDIGFLYMSDSVNDGAIYDGLWTYIKAEMNTYGDMKRYGYGYLRAPWSMNPSPYISRFTKASSTIPSCFDHYQLLGAFTSMVEFSYRSSFSSHGSMHGGVGGMFGCDTFYELMKSGYIKDLEGVNHICSNWLTIQKALFRSGLAPPLEYCKLNEDDISKSTCGFNCSNATPEELYYKIKRQFSTYMGTPNSYKDNVEVWSDFICNKGGNIFSGDHLEASSAADPSFWVMHPPLERIFQLRLLGGGFLDETWPSDAEKDYVCTYNECLNLETGIKAYDPLCCYGHYSDSKLLDATTGNRSSYIGMTNNEVFLATDPRSSNYAMPYIYDDFKWNHCEEDFDRLVTDMLEKSRSMTSNTNDEQTSNNKNEQNNSTPGEGSKTSPSNREHKKVEEKSENNDIKSQEDSNNNNNNNNNKNKDEIQVDESKV
eukprot:gene7907-10732_t